MIQERAVRDAEQKAEQILGALEDVVTQHLLRIGLSKREVKAEWAKVPANIKAAPPRDVLHAMVGGKIPARGFGLGSDTGTGKTMALAAIMRGFVRARVRAWAEAMPRWAREKPEQIRDLPSLRKATIWMSWPDTVTWIRARATDPVVEGLLQEAEVVPLLVLDDLGRERLKGSYVDDWAASQLDRIISHRYREELPILWATNLRERDLVERYGAAMVSRLTQDAPLAWIDGLRSMRLEA